LNILVVGASGFIGKNLLLKIPHEWRVFGTYRADTTFPEFLEKNELRNVCPIKCDLENTIEVKDALNGIESPIDVCVYLAANTNVRKLAEEPILDVSTNLAPLLNFLGYFKGRRLVFFSSGAVYMGLEGSVSPLSKINPTIPYAISKYASELYIEFYRNSLKTFKEYIVLRFFGAYGPYEPPRKISTKLIELIESPRENTFAVFGNGENYIDFMYIDDAIQGLMKVITSKKANVTVDFCFGSSMTINQLVKKVGRIFNKKIEIEHVGISPEYITFHASPRKMFQFFGFRPRISLEEGFSKLSRWLHETPDRYNDG
jgi:nucleoside-diphosphate-sugar epimerase